MASRPMPGQDVQLGSSGRLLELSSPLLPLSLSLPLLSRVTAIYVCTEFNDDAPRATLIKLYSTTDIHTSCAAMPCIWHYLLISFLTHSISDNAPTTVRWIQRGGSTATMYEYLQMSRDGPSWNQR